MRNARASLTGSIHVPGHVSGRTEHGERIARRLGKPLNRPQWTLDRMRAVMWRGLTLITCPCCIPIWLAVLSGTAVGALLSRNLFITVVLFLALFALCFWKAIRSYDARPDNTVHGDDHGTR